METAQSTELSQLAYYYPEPYWAVGEGAWIKSLLLFFDGMAILLPEYMSGRQVDADPSLAGPLTDRGLLKVLQPEWFVDQEMAESVGEDIIELIAGGAFDDPAEQPFRNLSKSRMRPAPTFGSLSKSRMGLYLEQYADGDVFQMIFEELKARGLALDSEDGVSIPLREDVRLAYLMLLAQEARAAGRRQGFDLHPTADISRGGQMVSSFLRLPPMPSSHDVIGFDQLTASINLEDVPLDDVLDFRQQHGAEHRTYMIDLRRFVEEISTAEPVDRQRLFEHRRDQLEEQARSLCQLVVNALRPKNIVGFGLAIAGSAWSLHSGDPVTAGLGALGASLTMLPSRDAGSAYSYIFDAHRRWS